jgi:hypothetical protein
MVHNPNDIDKSAIRGDRACGDCGAVPGAFHTPGCDVERCGCRNGGQQALSCGDCDDRMYLENRIRWSGEWPGKRECRHHGLYCHNLINGKPATMREMLDAQDARREIEWHVPCGKDAGGAREDLNRWHDQGCPGIPAEGS